MVAQQSAQVGDEVEVEEMEGAGNALSMTYAYDEAAGKCSVTIEGRIEVEITERVNEQGNVEFISPLVRAPQDNLKDALMWVAINAGKRAFMAEYERQNPKPAGQGKARRTTKTVALEEALAASDARTARVENMLAGLLAKLEGGSVESILASVSDEADGARPSDKKGGRRG